MKPPFTVEERAERFQRRMTGPWATHVVSIAPLEVSLRIRRRRRIEWVRLDVAWHDLWTHALARQVLLPILDKLERILGHWS